jgi:hypothetical protein
MTNLDVTSWALQNQDTLNESTKHPERTIDPVHLLLDKGLQDFYLKLRSK